MLLTVRTISNDQFNTSCTVTQARLRVLGSRVRTAAGVEKLIVRGAEQVGHLATPTAPLLYSPMQARQKEWPQEADTGSCVHAIPAKSLKNILLSN